MVTKLRGFFIDYDINSSRLFSNNYIEKRSPVYFTRTLKGIRWNRKGFIMHIFKKRNER